MRVAGKVWLTADCMFPSNTPTIASNATCSCKVFLLMPVLVNEMIHFLLLRLIVSPEVKQILIHVVNVSVFIIEPIALQLIIGYH